jgi:alanine racemase
MNRAGVPWDRIADLSWIASSSPPEGAFTHFHSAELDDGSMEEQLHRFDRRFRGFRTADVPSRGKQSRARAQRAVAMGPGAPGRLAVRRRKGLTTTDPETGKLDRWSWLNVASLHARIVEIREVADGETVSYGGTWESRDHDAWQPWRRAMPTASGAV